MATQQQQTGSTTPLLRPGVYLQALLVCCRGTVRKVNEDRYDVKVVPASSADQGEPFAFGGVYDGHGQLWQQQLQWPHEEQ